MSNEMTTDNMSNEEVIEVLKGIVFNSFDRTTPKERQALHLAIKSLAERPQGDCISREALKETFDVAFFNDEDDYKKALQIIDNAPIVESEVYMSGKDLNLYMEGYKQGKKGLDRPKGEWIIVKDEKWGDNVKCPFCGKELAGTDLNFCCKCGAKLIGSEKMNGGAK